MGNRHLLVHVEEEGLLWAGLESKGWLTLLALLGNELDERSREYLERGVEPDERCADLVHLVELIATITLQLEPEMGERILGFARDAGVVVRGDEDWGTA